MGILDKAKQADKSDDKKDEKPKAKKKHHHPSAEKGAPASAAPEGEDESEAGPDDEGAEQQPDSESDESESPSQSEGPDAGGEPPAQPQDSGGDQDQGAPGAQGPQDEGGQQAPQGGAPPVVNPQAPGAGDDSENTSPDDQGPETPGEDTAGGSGAEADIQQVPMSPGMQDEFQRLNQKIMQMLYNSPGDRLATAALKGIMPDGPGKIKGPALLAVHMAGQLHQQDQFPLQLLLPVVKDIVGHIMDLAEQVKQIHYTDQESAAILGLAYEVALRSSGITKQQAHQVHSLLGKQGVMKHYQNYQKAHAFAKPAMLAAHNGAQGGPQAAGPQSGAPAGTMAAPGGAAPTPAPEESAQSAEQQGGGGMLAQAAGQQGGAA